MNVFIYSSGPLSSALDEVEDALDEALIGRGEVTGSGIGKSGSNIDIEIIDENDDLDKVLSIVRGVLRQFSFPKSTKIKIDTHEFPYEA